MVEKKRFDGSDAKGTTGMLRALRARVTASGAVRGVTAAMASVAAMAMLGAVCVTPASALADVNADADASGVRAATTATRDGLRGRIGRNLIRRALAGAVRDFRDASGRERCDGRR